MKTKFFAMPLLLLIFVIIFILPTAATVPSFTVAAVQNVTENFESGTANWRFGTGWSVVEENRNHVLSGTQHSLADTDFDGTIVSIKFRMKLVNGSANIGVRAEQGKTGLHRYMIGMNENSTYIGKQMEEKFRSLSSDGPGVSLGIWHVVEVRFVENEIRVFLDGSQAVSASDAEPLVRGGIILEPLESSTVYFDDIVAEIEVQYDGIHYGDIELRGNEIWVLQNGHYKQYGNIMLHDNAQFIVGNSSLIIDRYQVPQTQQYNFDYYHWGIHLADSSLLVVENSTLEPALSTCLVVRAEDRARITMRDSATRIHLFEIFNQAHANVTNSKIVFEIGGSVGVGGNSDVFITNSTIGSVALFVGDGERLSARGLRTGRFENWSLQRDTETNVAYNLTLINTELIPDELGEGPFERGWVILTHPNSNISIRDSQLRKLILNLNNENAEFKNMVMDRATDFSYRNISLRNVTMKGQWGVFPTNSNVSIRDSGALFIIIGGNSNLTLVNATLNEFQPRDFHGTISFEGARWTLYSGITYNNDFVMRGSVEAIWGPGNPRWQDAVAWLNSNVTRFYEVNGRQNVNLTLKENGTDVWTGRTDSEGKAEFSIRFTDANSRNIWSLSDGIRTINVDFYTNTPINLKASIPTPTPTQTSKPTPILIDMGQTIVVLLIIIVIIYITALIRRRKRTQ